MNGRSKASFLVSCLALAGCMTATKEVKVRAIPDPSAVLLQGGDELAVSRGQFLLGNVGLALEGFRKAQRANPSDPRSLAGIGDCYASMGRFDLAQSNYEAALALAPHNQQFLLGLAAIFDKEGKPVLAMAARAETEAVRQAAMQSSAAVAAPAALQKVAMASARAPVAVPTARSTLAILAPSVKRVDVPRPSIGSITVELPRARPVERVDSQTSTLAITQREAALPTAVSSVVPAHLPRPVVPMQIAHIEIPHASLGNVSVELQWARPVEHVAAIVPDLPAAGIEAPIAPAAVVQTSAPVVQAPVEQLVAIPHASLESAMLDIPTPRRASYVEAQTAKLPPAEIEADVPASVALAAPVAPASPSLPRKPRPEDRAVAVALAPAPRLERLSAGEVALVTTGKALWSAPNKAPNQVRLASTNSVRWVALEGAKPNVQVLNAARSPGIAASARMVLAQRGWRRIAIGDAPAVLHRSEVLYPRSHAALGRRLAAQFGVAAHMAERDNVVLILGRDAVGRITGRRGS